MSGPKVVRVVTREEWEKRCNRALSLLNKRLERLKVAASSAGEDKNVIENITCSILGEYQKFNKDSRFQGAEAYVQLQAQVIEHRVTEYIERAAIREQQIEQRNLRSKVQAQQWLHMGQALPDVLRMELQQYVKGEHTVRTIDELLSTAERLLSVTTI